MYAERAINQTPGRGNLGIFSLRVQGRDRVQNKEYYVS